MAFTTEDHEPEERPSERRHREKKERDPNRSHKVRRSRNTDPLTGSPVVVVKACRNRSEEVNSSGKKIRKRSEEVNSGDESMKIVAELARTMSGQGATSRTSLPYPTFSKAHSKEAVRSDPRLNVYTPDPTDLADGAGTQQSTESLSAAKQQSSQNLKMSTSSQPNNAAPPSPPETELKSSTSKVSLKERVEPRGSTHFADQSKVSSKSKATELKPSSSKISLNERAADPRGSVRSTAQSKVSSKSKASTAINSNKKAERVYSHGNATVGGSETSAIPNTNLDSSASSVRGNKLKTKKAVPSRLRTSDLDYSSGQDSSPNTPTQTPQFPPQEDVRGTEKSPSTAYESSMPPPPPPPPTVPVTIPRVDYLMQNGGLSKPVRKALFTPDHRIEDLFRPFTQLLTQYQTVIDNQGSFAVATGYRSVARRLLDRVEVVMQRELSSERCACVMCQDKEDDDHKKLGWGDVLEWVSGRIELPVWPAFDFNSVGMKATEDTLRSHGPMPPSSPQKLDPDYADEFREHYLRLTEKKKKEVDIWLSSCPTAPASPPEEVDDQTLTFTIFTHLQVHERPIFNALLQGASQPIGSRTPNPFQKGRYELVHKAGKAIQRLYRLPRPPRDPETCIFLFKNPEVHNLLTTLTEINNQEWEILTSGRFDGFLWSGAESEFPSMNNSPMVSRNPTPANNGDPTKPSLLSRVTSPFGPNRNQTFSPPNQPGLRSQTSTPFIHGHQNQRHAVSNDEEMEIAVISEIERNLYQNMEAVEDAFEGLHRHVEAVRQELRDRSAALAIFNQSRRTTQPGIVCGTPGLATGYERSSSGFGYGVEAESDVSESECGWYDPTELGPSDSASQISYNRYKKKSKHRSDERKTPALIEEDETDN